LLNFDPIRVAEHGVSWFEIWQYTVVHSVHRVMHVFRKPTKSHLPGDYRDFKRKV